MTAAGSYHFLAAAATPSRGGITAFVTDALRSAIVGLDLKPGETIDKSAICAQLGVSRFPVSEALARLQVDGLVDILPQRGSIVSLVRVGDVLQNMLIRKALESEGVRALVHARTTVVVADLDANMQAQRRAAEADDPAAFHCEDIAFHDILFNALRYDKVKAAIDSARANLDRARLLILNPRRLSVTVSEHQAIVTAIAAGDADGAAQAMRRHLDAVVAELLTFARHRPELFADGHHLSEVGAGFPFG